MAQIVASGEAMKLALALLEAGDIVVIPTETVYGLAGDATNGVAVARIFEAKGRPSFNPLIAHVSDMAMAERIAAFDPLSRKLAEAFWPGPLTLVLPLAGEGVVHPLVTAGLSTVGLRMPIGFGAELIKRLGRPLAAPSANSSGRISGTSARAVADDLARKVSLIVDDGPARIGVESTIVKVEGGTLRLLRPGGIASELIEEIAGQKLLRGPAKAGIEAPGMLASHYAPGAAVRLHASNVLPGEALLAFGPTAPAGTENAVAKFNLSPSGDLREAASNLFSHLRLLDLSGARTIAVQPIPETGLGEAINDRLRRAAAPRNDSYQD